MDAMFLRYFVDLAMPFEDVEHALVRGDASSWLPGIAADAEARRAVLLADVGFEIDRRRVDRAVDVRLGPPRTAGGRTILPMSWTVAGPGRLFPALDADLEIARLGDRRTQLAMSGRYRPPMGSVGRALDRAVLHLVAEATIKDFLDRAAERLVAPDGASIDADPTTMAT